jgi:hypothetical protein
MAPFSYSHLLGLASTLALLAAPPSHAGAEGTELSAASSTAATAPGLEKLLKSQKADGPLKLPEAILAELGTFIPGGRKGEECEAGARVSSEAALLKDRGAGAGLVTEVTTCRARLVMAFSPAANQLLRVARIAVLAEGEAVAGALPLALNGKAREEDLGLLLSVQPHRTTLRVLVRRHAAFAFNEAGALTDFAEQGDCSAGGEVAAGFASFAKVDGKGRLQVLRVDDSCGAGPWAARCEIWHADSGALSKSAVCALPAKLDAKSLRAAGWR